MVRVKRLPSSFRSGTSAIFGYILELLTVADLNLRCSTHGGFAYLNPAPFTPDDVFVKTSLGWRTVQVKAAQVSLTRAGVSLNSRGRDKISSDILALVALDQMSVRYVGLTQPLPPELPVGVLKLCPCMSSIASTVSVSSSVDASTAISKTALSATTAESSFACSSRGPLGSPPVSTERAVNEHPPNTAETAR